MNGIWTPIRRSLPLLVIVLFITAAGCATASKPGAKAEAGGSTAKASPPSPPAAPGEEDFTKMRTEYGERVDFVDICPSNQPGALETAAQLAGRSDWQGVLALTEPWTKTCPVDVNARYLTAGALLKLGRESEAQEHIRWYRGLMSSILTSGDGRTPETAWVVISIPEEYAVVRALQVRPVEQKLLNNNIDSLTVETQEGTAMMYFNPAAHFRRLQRSLGEGDK